MKKMNVKVNVAAALLAGALFVPAAMASTTSVIDFNELTSDDTYFVDPLASGGFNFTNNCISSWNCLGVWGKDNIAQADPGHATIFVNRGFTITSMNRTDGGTFNLISIDLADAYNSGESSTIDFTFYHSGVATTSQSVTLDNLIGLQTFVFNETNLTSVSWQTSIGDGGYGQFDNVLVSSVPEPEIYAMLLVGLGLVGFTSRRKKV